MLLRNLGRTLRFVSGACLASLLIVAPLNFGSTRPGGPALIALVCAAATVLWAASLVLSHRRPEVPIAAASAAAAFMLAALPWLTGIAQPTPTADFTQTHFAHVTARWPVGILSLPPSAALLLLPALVAAFLPLIDLARERFWSRTFAFSIVLAATLVGLLAFAQNHTEATGIYWREDGRMPGTFSGTFFHHTSAGAFFNTAWPMAFAFTWLGWHTPRHSVASRLLTALAAFALVFLLAAHGSHVARFPLFAALLVAPLLIFGLGVKISGSHSWLYVVAGASALLMCVFIGGRADSIGARWSALFVPAEARLIQPPESAWPTLLRDDLAIPYTSHPGWFGDRMFGWRAALDAIAERPLTGHGPGNWMGAASQHSTDPFVRTFYQFLQFAHQDPLQSAVEWGLPAALSFWSLLIGALAVVAHRRLRQRISPLDAQSALAFAAGCGLAAVLLQSQLDFPLQIPAVALNAVALAALCWAAALPSPVA